MASPHESDPYSAGLPQPQVPPQVTLNPVPGTIQGALGTLPHFPAPV